MMEIQFQRHLIKAAEDEGGYGLKLSNQYQAGVPDLLIKLLNQPPVIFECKRLMVKKINLTKSYTNRITKIQVDTLTAMRNAGMVVGLVTLVQDETTHHDKIILVTVDFGVNYLHMNDNPIMKGFRKPWPVQEIIKRLSSTAIRLIGQ